MNASQSTRDDEPLLGATVQRSSTKAGTTSRWLANGVNQSEPSYRYWAVQPGTAEVLAVSESNDPLITRNLLGSGQVWLSTPDYLQSSGRQMLLVGTQTLDSLISVNLPARISGPPIQFQFNQAANKLLVTLINNTASKNQTRRRDLNILPSLTVYAIVGLMSPT